MKESRIAERMKRRAGLKGFMGLKTYCTTDKRIYYGMYESITEKVKEKRREGSMSGMVEVMGVAMTYCVVGGRYMFVKSPDGGRRKLLRMAEARSVKTTGDREDKFEGISKGKRRRCLWCGGWVEGDGAYCRPDCERLGLKFMRTSDYA